MAKKATASNKNVKAEKASPKAKPKAKLRASKGDSLACEVCGLSVVVEEIGNIAIGEVSPILCCGKPMKKKAKKAKAAKK